MQCSTGFSARGGGQLPPLPPPSGYATVHAFVTSHIDGCNTVLAGSPRTITDRLQRLLNAAARVVSNTGKFEKFDRGSTHLLHSELHWLEVPQRILHKLGVTVHRCLRQGSPVPHELLPPHIGCCQSSATSIFQSPPSRRTTTSSQHARPSGVLRRRSDGLERAA